MSDLEDLLQLIIENQWIYDFKITRFFVEKVWENISEEWLETVQVLTVSELNGIPYGIIQDHWPATLQEFITKCLKLSLPREQTLDRLPPFDEGSKVTPLDPSSLGPDIRRGMSEKKLHEVCHMTALIDHVTKMVGSNAVVDVGSGLGYLGQVLHTQYGHNVLGLEGKQCHTSGAEKRTATNKNSCPSIHNVTCELHEDSHSVLEFMSLLSQWISNLSPYHVTCCLSQTDPQRLLVSKHDEHSLCERTKRTKNEENKCKSESDQQFNINLDASKTVEACKPELVYVSKGKTDTPSVNASLPDLTLVAGHKLDGLAEFNPNECSTKLGCVNIQTNEDSGLETQDILKTNSHMSSEVVNEHMLQDNITEISDTPDKYLTSRLCVDGARVCLVGLHCCGDLTATMLQYYRHIDSIQALCCVSCCYHRMDIQEGKSSFRNFPMSKKMMACIERTNNSNIGWRMSTFGLRLAAQETRARWREQTSSDHDLHTKHVAYRGILELCLQQGDFKLKKTSRRLAHKSDYTSFETYVEALSHHVQSTHTDATIDHEATFTESMTHLYVENKQFFRFIEPFTALQVLLQPVVESLIHLDRQQWLLEHGYHSNIIPVFDEYMSPRNLVLVAMKSVT